jgi:serine/threonine protein kinase
MAVVYKAYDTRLERDVALKIIRIGEIPESQREKLLKRFEQEAKVQAKFMHANIVRVLDYGEYQNMPFLVMEYLPGGTLKFMRGRPMPYKQAAQLLIPISDALAYAHKRKVLHRDVKPSNILITEEGKPVLTDFGIAKILEAQGTAITATGVGVGTPEYMAPEQWRGKPVPQTDVYGLGVVLYEMVTGRRPYEADTPAAIIQKQVSEPLPRPSDLVPGLPEQVEKVLYKALALHPEDRYDSIEDFQRALEKLIFEAESIHTPSPVPVSQSPLPIGYEPITEPHDASKEKTKDDLIEADHAVSKNGKDRRKRKP